MISSTTPTTKLLDWFYQRNRTEYPFTDGGDNGLDPEEYEAAVATLQSLAATLDADCVELRQRKSEKGMTGQYLVRRRVDQTDFMEIR